MPPSAQKMPGDAQPVRDVEGTFKVDGHSLYTRSWLPGGPTKAKLVLIHGFSDHMDLYADFGRALAAAGIAVLGLDQRGWGKSVTRSADRGRTGGTATVVADAAAFVAAQLKPAAGAGASPAEQQPPVFVMGHSLGGGVVLALASDAAHEQTVLSRVRGWLLESPFLGWPAGEKPSAAKVTVGRLFSRVLPHFQLAHRIPAEYLTRDTAVVERIRADKLCHDLGTLEGLAATLDRTADLAAGKLALRAPVKSLWLGHGTLDKATSYDASRRWFDSHSGAVPDRTFQSYEGWFHQLHNETTKEEYFAHVIDWILERAGGKEDVATASVPAAATSTAAQAGPGPGAAPAEKTAAAKSPQAKPEAKL